MQSPAVGPNAAQNPLQSIPEGILGALLGSFGGHLGDLRSFLDTLFVHTLSVSFFFGFGGTPTPPESGIGGLRGVPLGVW